MDTRSVRRSALGAVAALAVLTLIVAGCAGLPAPRGPQDALVVGSVVLAFPDGLTGDIERRLPSNLMLHFLDTNTGRRICRVSSDGCYAFRARAEGPFILEGIEWYLREPQVHYSLRDRLALPLSVSPGRVCYQGHLIVRYERPRSSDRPAADTVITREQIEPPEEEEDYPLALLGMRTHTYWSYERSLERRNDEEAMMAQLRRRHPRSPWLGRDLAR